MERFDYQKRMRLRYEKEPKDGRMKYQLLNSNWSGHIEGEWHRLNDVLIFFKYAGIKITERKFTSSDGNVIEWWLNVKDGCSVRVPYWPERKLNDIPRDAKPIFALSNGRLCRCFVSKDGDYLVIHRTNPNSSKYFTFGLEEHISAQQSVGDILVPNKNWWHELPITYTMEDWKRDGSIKLFVGDVVEDAVIDQLAGAVPPHYWAHGSFQCGEPWMHDKDGNPLYQTFSGNKYIGLCQSYHRLLN